MPGSPFRGDPYRVLDVPPDASDEQIKRRWRDLAREHHPDRVGAEETGAEEEERGRRTSRMARINAAYDMLRDPVRRARYDASPEARRHRQEGAWAAWPGRYASPPGFEPPVGPPPPPPTRPVTARFDTSVSVHRRGRSTSRAAAGLRGHDPIDWRRTGQPWELRASEPTGPVRQASGARAHLPTLEEARTTVLQFGRFQGATLGQVAEQEPTYVDWIASTITRDRDLVVRARVIAADMDSRGVVRQARPSRSGSPGSAPTAEAGSTADRAAG